MEAKCFSSRLLYESQITVEGKRAIMEVYLHVLKGGMQRSPVSVIVNSKNSTIKLRPFNRQHSKSDLAKLSEERDRQEVIFYSHKEAFYASETFARSKEQSEAKRSGSR
ncbi:unnamed protein product [Cochlearia groenlandica]